MLVNYINFWDVEVDFFLDHIHIVMIEVIVGLQLYLALAIIRNEDSSVEGDYQQAESHPKPHEQPVNVSASLLVEAFLSEQLQWLAININRHQLVISIFRLIKHKFVMELKNLGAKPRAACIHLCLWFFTIRDKHLILSNLPIVEIVIVTLDIGVVPCLSPLVKSLHSVAQTKWMFFYDRSVMIFVQFFQKYHCLYIIADIRI